MNKKINADKLSIGIVQQLNELLDTEFEINNGHTMLIENEIIER